MSLSLAELSAQLIDFQGRVVDANGRISGDFQRFLWNVINQSEEVVATAQTAADSAQSSADTAQSAADTAQDAASNAAGTSSYHESNSPVYWYTDGAGTYPAGNPSADITTTFYDQDDNQIAQRVLRGTLATATGNITVAAQSNSGLTTTFALSGNGTTAVQATITVTLGDGSKYRAVVNWGSIDVSTGGELSY